MQTCSPPGVFAHRLGGHRRQSRRGRRPNGGEGGFIRQYYDEVVALFPYVERAVGRLRLQVVPETPMHLLMEEIRQMQRRYYRDHVAKGVKQIEEFPVDRGVVVVNMKNVLPFDRCWPAEEGRRRDVLRLLRPTGGRGGRRDPVGGRRVSPKDRCRVRRRGERAWRLS